VKAVREQGRYRGAAVALRRVLAGLVRPESGRALAAERVDVVARQQKAAWQGEGLVGSTEVLESLFGRFQAWQREHRGGGVTALALAVPALLGEPGEQEVAEAQSGCRTSGVRPWVRTHLTPSVQAQRCWLRDLVPKRKKNRAQTQDEAA
jgi:hypothetical protein